MAGKQAWLRLQSLLRYWLICTGRRSSMAGRSVSGASQGSTGTPAAGGRNGRPLHSVNSHFTRPDGEQAKLVQCNYCSHRHVTRNLSDLYYHLVEKCPKLQEDHPGVYDEVVQQQHDFAHGQPTAAVAAAAANRAPKRSRTLVGYVTKGTSDAGQQQQIWWKASNPWLGGRCRWQLWMC